MWHGMGRDEGGRVVEHLLCGSILIHRWETWNLFALSYVRRVPECDALLLPVRFCALRGRDFFSANEMSSYMCWEYVKKATH